MATKLKRGGGKSVIAIILVTEQGGEPEAGSKERGEPQIIVTESQGIVTGLAEIQTRRP